MGRMAREEVFAADEIAVVHVMNRVVRRCFLMGDDPYTGKNYNYRRDWIEQQLELLAGLFGIDLLTYAILSNHFHLVLRSRPDVVATWSDREIARRWRMLCPYRKHEDGAPKEPTDVEINSIASDPEKVAECRSRLSDISWWMRLISQRIAQRANREDEASGKFWEARFRAVRLLDEEAILACSAYVDLNPIRASIAETIERSDYTSAQRRCQSLLAVESADRDLGECAARAPDAFLAPIAIDELLDELGSRTHVDGRRCSDKGFLGMSTTEYLELLDWTARHLGQGKVGCTPEHTPPLFERMKIRPEYWQVLVTQFGKLFSLVAGQPHTIESYKSRVRRQRFRRTSAARALLAAYRYYELSSR